MKTLAICHPSIRELKPNLFFSDVEISSVPITVGLIEAGESELPSDAKYQDCVVVRKRAFSCNYRDKSLMLRFNQACQSRTVKGLSYYSPIGSEFVAEVVQVGRTVKSLKIGDRVIPDGSYPNRDGDVPAGLPTNYASQRLEMFHESQLHKIPDEIPDEVAASLTIGGHTVYSMLRRLSLKQGMKVLVTAATSNTSLMIFEALKKHNVDVYALSSSSKLEGQISELNIKRLIPSPLKDKNAFENIVRQVGPFDAVIDPFFDLHLSELVVYMSFNSSYITCGMYKQHEKYADMNTAVNSIHNILYVCLLRNISLIGNCLGERADLENAIHDLLNNDFSVKVDSVFSGNEIKEFFDRSFKSPERLGKVVYKYED